MFNQSGAIKRNAENTTVKKVHLRMVTKLYQILLIWLIILTLFRIVKSLYSDCRRHKSHEELVKTVANDILFHQSH